GRTIARRLHSLGWRIAAVVTRSPSTARAAARSIGAGSPRAALTPEVFDADVILLATPDGSLASVARSLAAMAGTRTRNKIVLHTSGALDSGVLAPLALRGASTGSMHPMQTFTGRTSPRLNGVIFAIEGSVAAVRLAERIARSLRAVPVIINARHK